MWLCRVAAIKGILPFEVKLILVILGNVEPTSLPTLKCCQRLVDA
jgi:hypothetical protein